MYYYFAEYSKDFLDIKRSATFAEYQKIEQRIKRISQMLMDKNRIDAISISYESLMESIDNLSCRNQQMAAKDVQYKLSQFLFEFKKFLDNWETEIKRKYGKESDEIKIFKTAQAQEFDNHMEYRIMYRLRNYDQHCGNIVSNISCKINENEEREYKVLANRDILLNNFKEWKEPEIDYLNQQDEEIEMIPYIKQLYASTIKIHEKTMQIDFSRELYNDCAEIIGMANEFENEEYVIIISSEHELKQELEKQSAKKLVFTDLMVATCKQILTLHIKNNLDYVRVFFCGETLRERLGGCAIEVEPETFATIANTQVVNIDGKRMLRLLYSLYMDKREMYAALLEMGHKRLNLNELDSDYSKYLSALCKR